MKTNMRSDEGLRDALLQEGDVIFSCIPNPLYRQIAQATGSITSHVGIVFRDDEGKHGGGWCVAESNVPVVRYSSLEHFVDRSIDGWHVIRRVEGGLTSAQVALLRTECDLYLGTLYHSGFRYQSRRTFCSKFVYQSFRHALGIEVGTLETFAELLGRRPATALTFWRLWFFGFIPWSRLTVTPASQLESPRLHTVWQSHPGTEPVGFRARRDFVQRMLAWR